MTKKMEPDSPQTVDAESTAKALAKAVHEGDFVNFRFIFGPFSPARPTSGEEFAMPKYDYLLPNEELENDKNFLDLLGLVKEGPLWAHIENELHASRPAQMPSQLLLRLADNAVRLKKYGYASQTYELLRIRKRMKEEFFAAADAALEAGDISTAVAGYIIAAGLSYDYAAFPEPLPKGPDFQTRALMIHAEYPHNFEDCVGMFEPEQFLDTALAYLLYDPETAARLSTRTVDTRLAFLRELVAQRDPEWDEFSKRYGEAVEMMEGWGKEIVESVEEAEANRLKKEIESQQREDPRTIAAHILGRTIENGEWWQYMKELAYEHPASILFVARQVVGDTEVVVPRVRHASPVVTALELLPAGMAQAGQAN